MIRPIVASGVNRAVVVCDDCGREEVVTCDYIKHRRDGASPNIGQINQKMAGRGWAYVRNVLRCPSCEARRRAVAAEPKWLADAKTIVTEEVAMAAKTDSAAALRHPTPDQRGDIIEMLVACYDRKARRYRGSDTDKTVAEAVGNGCLPGWVAHIREENFGPAGGNEEIEAIRAEIEALRVEDVQSRKERDARINALTVRLDKVMVAVGPRAAK